MLPTTFMLSTHTIYGHIYRSQGWAVLWYLLYKLLEAGYKLIPSPFNSWSMSLKFGGWQHDLWWWWNYGLAPLSILLQCFFILLKASAQCMERAKCGYKELVITVKQTTLCAWGPLASHTCFFSSGVLFCSVKNMHWNQGYCITQTHWSSHFAQNFSHPAWQNKWQWLWRWWHGVASIPWSSWE